MYIVVVGGGKIGLNLTKILEKKRHEVAVIEQKPEHIQKLVDQTNALVIHGDGTDIKYLEEANIADADVFVAVTGVDENNLVACQLAKMVFGVPKVVVRVNNPANTQLFRSMNIDVAFDGTQILANLISENLGFQELLNIMPIAKGKLEIAEAKINHHGASGKTLSELGLTEKGILVASILRQDKIFVPNGNTTLEPNDSIIAIMTPESVEDFKKVFHV
ncbi:MAG: NAD-binding protein [Caldiserica bacterium]|nr:NAD-binding protein [Caldisericota bacterium]